jgi:ribosomal protein S18 acetylase RimI-like enzyme
MTDFTPRIRRLTDPSDPHLPAWLALYERAFPPEERVPPEEHLQELRPGSQATLLAAEDEAEKLVGLARYDLYEHAAYLYYLAVDEAVRSLGVGSAMYREILRQLAEGAPGLAAMVFEVERPDHAADAELAERRIRFYQRLGAGLLRGIHYVQEIPGQPPVPMHLMVHPFRPLEPSQALDLAAELFEVQRTDEPLALE